jgi:phage-related protein
MEIEYWENERGDAVVLDDIELQPPKLQAKIQWVIERLEEVGLALEKPHRKKLKGYEDFHELIANHGNLGYRVFFVVKQGKAWLVHSFRKGSNETPKRHIMVAVNRAKTITEGRST